jgi:hypothetical protein
MAVVTKKASVLRQATERASRDVSGYVGAGELFRKMRGDFSNLTLNRQPSIKKERDSGAHSSRKAKK